MKDELYAILAAVVGGARYGAKIRLPHALVMTFLFRRDLSSKDKLRNILKLAYEHASGLASFAAIYKTILALLKFAHRTLVEAAASPEEQRGFWKIIGRALLSIVDGPLPGESALLQAAQAPPGHPERIHHALIAGGIGGYFVWGRQSSLNQQVVLYLASRVLMGLWNRIHPGETQQTESGPGSAKGSRTFPFFASLIWAIVMALWEESPGTLHPSLKKSMDEIYRFQLSQPELLFQEVEPPVESRTVSG